MYGTVPIFMGLEVDGMGAAGSRIIRNAWDCRHFYGFGSGWEGGSCLQNHNKYIGLPSFSWSWKWAVKGQLAPESEQVHRTVIICMVLEVGGRGSWLQNHDKYIGLSSFAWF